LRAAALSSSRGARSEQRLCSLQRCVGHTAPMPGAVVPPVSWEELLALQAREPEAADAAAVALLSASARAALGLGGGTAPREALAGDSTSAAAHATGALVSVGGGSAGGVRVALPGGVGAVTRLAWARAVPPSSIARPCGLELVVDCELLLQPLALDERAQHARPTSSESGRAADVDELLAALARRPATPLRTHALPRAAWHAAWASPGAPLRACRWRDWLALLSSAQRGEPECADFFLHEVLARGSLEGEGARVGEGQAVEQPLLAAVVEAAVRNSSLAALAFGPFTETLAALLADVRGPTRAAIERSAARAYHLVRLASQQACGATM
jgi:hypothetical protein